MSQFHCIPYKRNFLYNLNDLIKIELTPAHWKKWALCVKCIAKYQLPADVNRNKFLVTWIQFHAELLCSKIVSKDENVKNLFNLMTCPSITDQRVYSYVI